MITGTMTISSNYRECELLIIGRIRLDYFHCFTYEKDIESYLADRDI